MATRINTKFVIILASVLVALTGGGVFAVMQLKKSAADHVRIAEQAMQEAEEAIQAGDIEKANNRLVRAGTNFYAAKSKDATNTEHLYRFIDSHRMVICSDLTLANNELEAELYGAVEIHDTPGASDKDRQFLYDLLNERLRMRLVVNKNGALGYMLNYSGKRLNTHPNDAIAKKNNAIAKSYLVEREPSEDQRLAVLTAINESIKTSPEDPWLKLALARYHTGDARRIYRAEGNTFTDQASESFALANQVINRVLDTPIEDPALMLEAVSQLLQVRSNNEDVAAEIINQQIKAVIKLGKVLEAKDNRDRLFLDELSRVVAVFRGVGSGNEENPFDAQAQATKLAQAVLKDRPEEPAAYALLGMIYRETLEFEKAQTTIEKGLDIERNTNALQFVRDELARLDMLSNLAEVKIIFAAQSESDRKKRTEWLVEAGKLLEQLALMPTSRIEWRDARVQFLRGRIDLAYGRPKQAVVRFEKANQAYGGSDLQTLRFLAETHRQLGNDAMLIKLSEQIVQRQPTSPMRLTLAEMYINQQEGQQLDLAAGHIDSYLAQFPNNLQAIRLKARLSAQRGDAKAAIQMLLAQDIEKNPELQTDIARYQALTGNFDDVAEMLRKQIASRADGEPINLGAVNNLLNALREKPAKLAEIDRLAKEGLDTSIAAILRKFVNEGSLNVEDELKLLEARQLDPDELAIRKFQLYQVRNMPELARQSLQEAVRLAPDRPDVLGWRFRVALSDQKWDEAEEAIKRILALDVNERPDLAVSNGDFMRARLQASKAIALDAGPERDQALRGATVAYNQALDQYGFFVDGWIQLGRLQLIQSNFFAAQDSLREALSLQGRNVEALEYMARAEIGAGDQARALDRYELILRIRPSHPTALNSHTALAQQIGQPASAIALREQVRDRNPGNTNNRRVLAVLYAQDLAYDKAQSEIDAVIKVEGKTLDNMTALCRILLTGNKPAKAVEAASAYVSDRKAEATWQDHLLLAQTLEQTDQEDKAETAFSKAIEMEGADSSIATAAWGQALLGRGKQSEAAMVLEDLIKRQPENQQLIAQTAQLYIQLKDFAKAESLTKTLKESPERHQLMIQSALGQEGQFALAIERAKAGVKDFPNHFPLRLQLAQLLLAQQNRRPEESRDYDEVLAMSKRLSEDYEDRVDTKMLAVDVLIAMGQSDDVVSQLESILDFAPNHLPANERLYGIKLQQAQAAAATNPELSQALANEALAIVAVLIQNRPDLPVLNRSAGQAAEVARRFDQASEYFRKAFAATNAVQDLAAYAGNLLASGKGSDARALLESPDNASLVSNNLFLRALRGRALAASGQPDQAATLFLNIMRSADNANAREMLARQASIAFSSDPERAVKTVEEALGESMTVSIDNMLCSLLISNKQYDPAIERLSKYELNPVEDVAAQFTILLQLALARQESNKLSPAKETYELAYALKEKNPDAIPDQAKMQLLNNLAYLLADRLQGYEKQAVVYAQEAVNIIPKEMPDESIALVEDTLGWAMFKAGRIEDAIRVLETSVERFALAANQLHLGQVYLAKEDKNRALLVLEAALNKAKADNDEDMIKQVQEWYKKAL